MTTLDPDFAHGFTVWVATFQEAGEIVKQLDQHLQVRKPEIRKSDQSPTQTRLKRASLW